MAEQKNLWDDVFEKEKKRKNVWEGVIPDYAKEKEQKRKDTEERYVKKVKDIGRFALKTAKPFVDRAIERGQKREYDRQLREAVQDTIDRTEQSRMRNQYKLQIEDQLKNREGAFGSRTPMPFEVPKKEVTPFSLYRAGVEPEEKELIKPILPTAEEIQKKRQEDFERKRFEDNLKFRESFPEMAKEYKDYEKLGMQSH